MPDRTCVSRRWVLTGGSSLLCWLAAGCGDDGAGGGSGGVDESSSDASVTTAGPSTSATETAADDTTTGSECEMQGWLAGGTAFMAGDYPNPFDAEPTPDCTLTSSQPCGPCYDQGPQRKDISAGQVGLPMRMNFRLIYEGTCEPVAGATLDVWFTNIDGVYSGETPSTVCNNEDADATAADWMRGRQSTDDAGETEFDACYPSWYPGRAPHIHVLVVVDGVQHYVTQLYFPNELSADVFATHDDYSHRPLQSTSNEQDGIFDPAAPNFMNTRKTYDCAMQAWITIAIPEAAQDDSC